MCFINLTCGLISHRSRMRLKLAHNIRLLQGSLNGPIPNFSPQNIQLEPFPYMNQIRYI